MGNSSELTSLRDIVRKFILGEISSGALNAGDKISEQGIADAVGISRTPAREALLQLYSEGLLDYFPRRGFAIKTPTDREKNENYEMIALLDSYCAMSAIKNFTQEDIALMNQYIDKIDIAIKYKNIVEYSELQENFHYVYRNKCENILIIKTLENIENGIAPKTFISEDTDELMNLYSMLNDEHRKIVQLFKDGNGDKLFNYLLKTHWALRYIQHTKISKSEKKKTNGKEK